jgi:hypothetical protein
MSKLLDGERLLWEGRPGRWAAARDILHIRWVLLYVAIMLVWSVGADRMHGASMLRSLADSAPVAVAGVLVLGGCLALGMAIARTTRYVVTSDRIIFHYGVALTATLSIPLRRVASVAVAVQDGGAGAIALKLKPGPGIRYVKLWPHARPWRFSAAQPMLRAVSDPVAVASIVSKAAAMVTQGVLHAAPETRPVMGVGQPELSAAGD